MITIKRKITLLKPGHITLALLFLFPVVISFGVTDGELKSVLARMEQASGNFESFIADTEMKKYSVMFEEFETTENGIFYYKRADDGSALIRWEIPGKRILTIHDEEALAYQPRIKSAQRYNLGENKDKAEYLALGIGQSPKDLEETFHISYLGKEKVRDEDCSILEFRPKDVKTANMYTSIIIWVKDSTSVSARMKLLEPTEDYLLVEFSNEKLNEKIDKSKFRQKLPKDVDILTVN